MQSEIADFTRRHQQTLKPAKALLRALATPLSIKLCKDLDSKSYQSIVDATVSPHEYHSAEDFRKDYLAVQLLRKFDSFPLGIDTAAVAIGKFLESELACGHTNKTKVRPYVIRDCGLTPESYISCARDQIRHLLGPFDWNQASEQFSFSGGASTRLKRSVGAPFYKFQGKPETTRNNALLAVCAIWSIPLWRAEMQSTFGLDPCDWVKIVDGSRITTVAKTAKTDRCIAIEPDMNMFIQKGIGAVIRRKLKSVNIDLNDQTHNQKLAEIGSGTGSLVTIDLASASDSIALELVRLLLPPDWFEALCLCRSEVGILPNGISHRFEKISSMGNGYTFELESLIFWALSKSVLILNDADDRRLGIYGDDIVIHNSVADELIKVLDYCGFKTNSEKTFLVGPFRESCGKHYFHGEDVTPFQIKTPLDALPRKFWFTNSLRLWSSLTPDPNAFQSVYEYSVKLVPRAHRYCVPMTLGSECGFWVSFDEISPTFHSWKQAYSTKLLKSRRKKHTPNGTAAVLHYFNSKRATEKSGPLDYLVKQGSSPTELEKGETRYYHSKVYLSWWDAAPCGVTFGQKLLG